MGYRVDSIAVSCNMGPLSHQYPYIRKTGFKRAQDLSRNRKLEPFEPLLSGTKIKGGFRGRKIKGGFRGRLLQEFAPFVGCDSLSAKCAAGSTSLVTFSPPWV